jgi:hypothetical protein
VRYRSRPGKSGGNLEGFFSHPLGEADAVTWRGSQGREPAFSSSVASARVFVRKRSACSQLAGRFQFSNFCQVAAGMYSSRIMERAKNKSKSHANVKQKSHKVNRRSISHATLWLISSLAIASAPRNAAGVRTLGSVGSWKKTIACQRAETHVRLHTVSKENH